MTSKSRTKKKSVLASADPNELISLAEASRRFGLSQNYLRTISISGRLHAKKIGRDWLTTPLDVENYITTRKRRGVYREDLGT